MKKLFAFVLLTCGAAPAVASGGYVCTTPGEKPIEVGIVTGHGIAPMIAQVRLSENGQILSTADEKPRLRILQSWIDDREIRLDLAEPNVRHFEARLRAKMSGPLSAEGTLERAGKIYKVHCSGEQ